MRKHAELIKRWADDPTMEIEYCYELYEALQLIEQRLALAVDALESIAAVIRNVANAALKEKGEVK